MRTRTTKPKLSTTLSEVLALTCLAHTWGVAHALNALFLTETGGFRQSVINTAYTAVETQLQALGWSVTRTDESEGFFTYASLASYDVVVFFFTSGDGNPGILDASEKQAFMDWYRAGKGYVGVHAASDTYQTQWPWYNQLVGAGFTSHPAGTPSATVRIEDRSFSATSHLPERWVISDEWYNFNFAYSPPRSTLHVLATVDENTYSGGTNGPDHPIVWSHYYDGGRSFYTGLGHAAVLWSDPDFVKHVVDGILWAEGGVGGDAGASLESNYQKSVLYAFPDQPVAGAVTPDVNDKDRVFWVERTTGNVYTHRFSTGQNTVIRTIPVFGGLEDGLMGIAFDPNFVSNQYVYFFYSPVGIDENRISRFSMNGDTFSLASEEVVLSIPTQRVECCHSGGHLKFGPDGNLWLTVGDNTNPFASNNYAPIDERSGRSPWDAQKSSSNTNDLRGKILRITVQPNGTYTCPTGNLFTQDATHRCEIYVMGNRNPYRMAVNPFNANTIYWGEVGPDAGSPNANRGPAGHDEVNKADSPGNYGWPYCLANNQAYNDYNFANSQSGSLFDCANPVNNSPNNNGAFNLPAARSAIIWYSDGSQSNDEAVPEGGGHTATTPYMHKHDLARLGPVALPPYFDRSLFFAEWSRDKLVQYIMDSNGDLMHALPLWDSFEFRHPIDLFTANDGSVIVIEFGTDFSGSGARISRMEYTAGVASINCVASGSPTAGSVPLTVQFDGSQSSHSQGAAMSYEWDFDGDHSTSQMPQHTYSTSGDKIATLRVYETGNPSIEGICTVNVAAGNNLPVVTILQPPLEGAILPDGEFVNEVSVFDVEDGSTPAANGIDCANVFLETSTGHEDHAHGFSQQSGCITVSQVPGAAIHDLFLDWTFTVSAGLYTDQGAPGVGAAQGQTLRQLHPRMRQAEKFSAASNPVCEANAQLARFSPVSGCSESTTDTGGGLNIGWVEDGSWLRFDNYNPHNVDSVTFRVASNNVGAEVAIYELRIDDPVSGTVIATASVPGTGGWQNWVDVNVPLLEPNQLFDIDLGFEHTVSAINLDSAASPGDYPRGYQVYVAGSDGVYGSPIRPVHRAEPNPDTNAVQQITLCQQESGVHYVRILQTGNDPAFWWSIHEVQVLDQNSQAIAIQLVSASREATTQGDVAANAIDGDLATRWSTGEPQNGGPFDLYLLASVGADGPTGAGASLANIGWFRFDGGLGASRASGAPVLAHAINSAGGSFTAGDGIAYNADRDFSSSSTTTVTNAISGTSDDTLYQSERWANADSFSYTLAVTANKTYRITFKLAEIWTGITAAGQRVFDIVVEGQTAFQDVDIYAAVGPFAAYDLEYVFVATDNLLDIQFQSHVENAKSNAILVQEIVASSPAVPSCGAGGPPPPDCVVDADCADSNVCNGVETCVSGMCMAGTPLVCDDVNACNGMESCDSISGCQAGIPLVCDDSLGCNGVETCDSASGCVAGTPIDCDDSNECTVDSCIEPGSCQHDPLDGSPILAFAVNAGPSTSSYGASDGYTYQSDQYSENGNTATHADPISVTTDDELYQSERWADPDDGQVNYQFPVVVGKEYQLTLKFAEIYNGITAGGQRVFHVDVEGVRIATNLDLFALVGPDTPYDLQHTYMAADSTLNIDFVSEVENAKIGAILVEELPPCTWGCTSDVECRNGNVCDGVETCNLGTGQCEPGTPLLCNDGNMCNGLETCDAVSGCQAGTPLVCDDSNPCTDDSCNAGTGCVYTPNVLNSCDDGNACNGAESCNAAGICDAGTPLVCNDYNPCTTDSCDNAIGCVYMPDDGNSCLDGDACNGLESCVSGLCQAGTPLLCDDGNICNGLETCDSASGCVAGSPLVCDDGLVCNGAETCDPVGGCQAGTAPNCNDGDPCTDDLCVEPTGCQNPDSGSCVEVTIFGTLLADASVRSNRATTNYGSRRFLRVRGSSNNIQRSLLKFSVADLPLSASIQSVVLHVLTENRDITDVSVYTSGDNSWQENTVTWSTQPALDMPAVFMEQSLQQGTVYDFSLPISVISGDGIYTFVLGTSDTNSNRDFESREGGYASQLEIRYI